MTFDSFAWIRRVRDEATELDAESCMVLFQLSLRANVDGECWPSLVQLAADSRLHKATVVRRLEELSRSGWLEVQRSKGRVVNRYRLSLPANVERSQRATVAEGERSLPAAQRSLPAIPTVAGSDPKYSGSTQEAPMGSAPAPADAPKPAKRQSRKTPRTPAPDSLEPNEATRSAARELGLNVAVEVTACLDHHRAKGSLMADWQATVRTWLRMSARFAGPRTPRRDDPPPGFIEHSQRPESRWLGGTPKRRAGQPTLAFGGSK